MLPREAEREGKHGTTQLARSWTSLLENGGIKVQLYDTDPGSILIVSGAHLYTH